MFDDFENSMIDADNAALTARCCEESLKPPRQMKDCLGHDDIEKSLLDQIAKDRLPHALIFSGLRGIGKATMAFRLARYLLKTGKANEYASDGDNGLFGDGLPKEEIAKTFSIESDDPVFRQVSSGGHADLMTIERLFDEKKNRYKGAVEVNEIRRITPFMRMTASQGGWRIVIVDDADTMNRNAQNAILKILEEPPEQALLILVCHRLGALIPTIRSRCRAVAFAPLNADNFSQLIHSENGNLPQEDMEIIYNISYGSVGQALSILDEGGLEIIEKIMELLNSWPKWQWSKIHMVADSMSKPGQEDRLRRFQEVLLWVVNSLLRAKARGKALQSPLDNEVTQKLLAHYSLNDWIEISGRIQEHFNTVNKANLDKRHSIIGAFSLFKKAV